MITTPILYERLVPARAAVPTPEIVHLPPDSILDHEARISSGIGRGNAASPATPLVGTGRGKEDFERIADPCEINQCVRRRASHVCPMLDSCICACFNETGLGYAATKEERIVTHALMIDLAMEGLLRRRHGG
jgi:hypothetical protein